MSELTESGPMTPDPNPMKDHLVDIAARAEYEALRASLPELEDTQWETLPHSDGTPLPSPRSKAYYRDRVSTAVEALWRAGEFYWPRKRAEEYAAGVMAGLLEEGAEDAR